MQRQRQKQAKRRRWFITLSILLAVIVIASIVFFIYIYTEIQKSKQEEFSDTIQFAKHEIDLIEIDAIDSFYEEKSYHILFGVTTEQKELITFIPIDQKEDYETIEQKEVIPKEHIRKKADVDCDSCQILRIKPAMIDDHPLWEVTYWDHEDRYVFDYFSMYDGSRYERLQMKQMFQ